MLAELQAVERSRAREMKLHAVEDRPLEAHLVGDECERVAAGDAVGGQEVQVIPGVVTPRR